jgi:hypothetical protein
LKYTLQQTPDHKEIINQLLKPVDAIGVFSWYAGGNTTM